MALGIPGRRPEMRCYIGNDRKMQDPVQSPIAPMRSPALSLALFEHSIPMPCPNISEPLGLENLLHLRDQFTQMEGF